MGILTKVFGTHSDHAIKKIMPIVKKIEALEDDYKKLSDEALKAKTNEFKDRLSKGETEDDILPEAFATMREAADRVLGMRPFRVQLIGGIVLHQGRIAEMKTGEGKTLTATLPSYLNALCGKGVHIVTVNDYLARRDSEWMGKIYNFLGLSVGLIVHGASHADKKAAYDADITYCTNNELGFDYLRDNMVIYKEQMVQRGHAFAIVDEVDSILIDEARTPLIISGTGDDSTPMYATADAFVKDLRQFRIKEIDAKESDENIDADYIVDEKARTAVLTPKGIEKAEKHFKVENLGDPENSALQHHITQAMRARGVMKKDIDYVVKNDQVLIVDGFTGRIMPGRRYSDGLHQAIEAKEGVKIEKESKTLATITFQNFFRLYKKLSGMTGTALTEESEFKEIYALDVVEIPTNMPMVRDDRPDRVFKTQNGKYIAIIKEIKECVKREQPVLVGTVSIEKSELLSRLLDKEGIKHNVLNAKHHLREAEIIAQAGCPGTVTISTNMAGRGTDIKLGGNPEYLAKAEMRKEGMEEELIALSDSFFDTDDENIIEARKSFSEKVAFFKKKTEPEAEKVRAAGGLYIIGTERHESRRIDNQLRGRAGRQGDPGVSAFYLSFEDDLLRLFGSERVIGVANALGLEEDQQIDAKIISNSVENAQKRLEGNNFQRRKTVLMYDDVMNQQRNIIYDQRRSVLDGKDLKETLHNMMTGLIESTVDSFCSADVPDEFRFDELKAHFMGLLTTEDDFKYTQEELNRVSADSIKETLLERAEKLYASKEELFGADKFREVERVILLKNVDRQWMDHLDAMNELMGAIGLHAYGQRNPVTEYKIQGSVMFEELIDAIRTDTIMQLFRVFPVSEIKREQILKESENSRGLPGTKSTPVRKPGTVPVTSKKVGRNDPCPCGSGKKYKKCCGANQETNSSEE